MLVAARPATKYVCGTGLVFVTCTVAVVPLAPTVAPVGRLPDTWAPLRENDPLNVCGNAAPADWFSSSRTSW